MKRADKFDRVQLPSGFIRWPLLLHGGVMQTNFNNFFHVGSDGKCHMNHAAIYCGRQMGKEKRRLVIAHVKLAVKGRGFEDGDQFEGGLR